MNKELIDTWFELINLYKEKKLFYDKSNNIKDSTTYAFKIKALNHVYSILRKFPDTITNVKQLSNIPGVGASSKQKLQESKVGDQCAGYQCSHQADH